MRFLGHPSDNGNVSLVVSDSLVNYQLDDFSKLGYCASPRFLQVLEEVQQNMLS